MECTDEDLIQNLRLIRDVDCFERPDDRNVIMSMLKTAMRLNGDLGHCGPCYPQSGWRDLRPTASGDPNRITPYAGQRRAAEMCLSFFRNSFKPDGYADRDWRILQSNTYMPIRRIAERISAVGTVTLEKSAVHKAIKKRTAEIAQALEIIDPGFLGSTAVHRRTQRPNNEKLNVDRRFRAAST